MGDLPLRASGSLSTRGPRAKAIDRLGLEPVNLSSWGGRDTLPKPTTRPGRDSGEECDGLPAKHIIDPKLVAVINDTREVGSLWCLSVLL